MITAVCLNPSLDKTLYVKDFQQGATNRVLRGQQAPGGKGVNVSRLLASFSLETQTLMFLGQHDRLLMEEALSAWGCALSAVMLPGRLRVNVKVMDESRTQVTELNTQGNPVAAQQLEEMQRLVLQAARQSRWLCLCGSLPPGCPSDYYARLIREVRQKAPGCRVALDCSGESLNLALREGPDLVKPNLEELSAFAGRPIENLEQAEQAVRALQAGGASEVILSLGAKGARLYSGQERYFAPGLSLPVVTTVGAGDAMLAGYIAGREQGLSAREAFRLSAASAAALIAGQPGSRDQYLALAEVRQL